MFKTVISKHDNPAGDFHDNEVRGMYDDRKAEWAGKEVIFVNPKNTSKTC